MRRHHLMCIVLAALAGCAPQAPRGALLAGERSVRIDAPVEAAVDRGPAVIPMEHVFGLTNAGREPAVIASHRTRIDTTWHFADSGNSTLPRTVLPGETVPVAVTAKVRRRPDHQRFYVVLGLASGEDVGLELLVDR